MKSNALHTIWIATLLLSGSVSDNGFAQIPGGFSGIALTDPDAVAAARFAVSKQGTAMNFVGIESVDRQVVAGMNYRLTIKVSENGAARTADAVVWRKLDGSHQLTSWTWIGAKAVTAQPGLVKSEFIYETAPFPSCHASTIVQTARGGLVAAWFGGTAEKNPDVGIWVARLERGRWSAPIEVANGIQYRKADGSVVRHPTWNPVLFQPTTGPLMLFYKAGPNPEEWWGMLTASTDGGKSWEQPRRLPEGILGPIKNKPVQLANGDILSPTSNETHEKPSKWLVHFERSSDFGKTWELVGPVNDGVAIQAIQPSILFLGGDNLLALGRSRQDRVFEVRSTDNGKSWGPMSLGTLPNNNSGTDAVTLKDGRHLIVYNHIAGTPGKWGGKRTPLNVAISSDAKTWQAALVLESDPGEYSYPAIIQTGDGLVHITYTWKRQKVKHAVVDPTKLVVRDMINGDWPK